MAGFLDLTGLSRFKKKLLEAVYEINEFRRKSTAYNVGDKVDCAFQYERFLECTKVGTTSGELLDTRNVTHGQVITDGTVEWTVRTHVRSVNGNVAGADGNVLVDVGVKTVNGNGPDESGNVVVDGLALTWAERAWTLQADVAAGATITIPDALTYIVGRRHLRVSWNGLVLYPAENFNEIGSLDARSKTFSLTFPAKAGDTLDVWVGTLSKSA